MPGQDTVMGTLRAVECNWLAVADVFVRQKQFKAERKQHRHWLESMHEVKDAQ